MLDIYAYVYEKETHDEENERKKNIYYILRWGT